METATGDDRPAAEAAAEATRDAIALVNGTLWPCWSWDGEDELWAGKYKTTGHGSLIVTNLQGRVTFVPEPVTGNQHDMAKLKGSAVEKIDYRRPLKTFTSSFRAAIGLYFFKEVSHNPHW